MNIRPSAPSRRPAAPLAPPQGMPSWLHRLTATLGALAIGLLAAFVVAVGGARPTEAAAPPAVDLAPRDTVPPAAATALCRWQTGKADQWWCVARVAAQGAPAMAGAPAAPGRRAL